MKKILLLSTGGTIASAQSKEGLVPSLTSNSLLDIIGSIDDCEITCEDIMCLDSSNMQPEEWITIARYIDNIYKLHTYDGVVVTHGTDTMAYTASALSFMLHNIKLPVILTGSQLPLTHPLSDGVDNIKLAIHAANEEILHGVYIAFNRKIMLGTRSVKVRTTNFDAFESINHEEVGYVDGKGLQINKHYIKIIDTPYYLYDQLETNVLLLKLIPGMNPNVLDTLLTHSFKGVVIEAFGTGGINFIRRDLITKLEQLVNEGISVVVCSQCLYENSDFSIYQTGQKVLQQGVIQALDMTSEACVTKLMWALGQCNNPMDVKIMFEKSYAKEINL